MGKREAGASKQCGFDSRHLNSIRYSRLLVALWRASSVEGFSSIAERSRRVGRTQRAIQPTRCGSTRIDSAIVAGSDSRHEFAFEEK